MKKTTNESITKHSANLDDIINNVDELDVLLNSREFITSLVNDLINGKRNVVEWKLVNGNGSTEDIEPYSLKDTFGVDYSFDFKYKYQNKVISLTIFITGNVPVNIKPVNNGDHMTPPSGGNIGVDYKNMGKDLSLGLFDQDGSEINVSWLTSELKARVTKELLQDYV